MIADIEMQGQKIMTKKKSEGKKKDLKKGDALFFRAPSDEFAVRFGLAVKASGLSQSDLLRRCVELKLDEVLDILERERQSARQTFQRYLEEKKQK